MNVIGVLSGSLVWIMKKEEKTEKKKLSVNNINSVIKQIFYILLVFN